MDINFIRFEIERILNKFKRPIKITSRICLCILIPLITFNMFSEQAWWILTNKIEPYYSTKGIELFYTGDGFQADYYDMFWKYEECYNTTEDSLKEWIGFSEPKKIYECGNVDCKDFSFAIKRLAELYNITCDYYSSKEFSGVHGNVGHLGIRCLMDYGEWELLN